MSSESEPFMQRRGIDSLRELDLGDVKQAVKMFFLAVWAKMPRRVRLFSLLVLLFILATFFSEQIADASSNVNYPTFRLEYAEQQKSPYNESKVALLIENRPSAALAPVMLSFISVVPPDWRFRFMGSVESIKAINESAAIREQVKLGKLDLTFIPSNMSTGSQEEISRFLTTAWLYDTVLKPAEWLLMFQTDSILCANSAYNINDYLEYDWVGAPWNPNSRWGGNGGLSLRRVSAILEVLKSQRRIDGSEPEDLWLTERLGDRIGTKVANASVSLTFAGETLVGRVNNKTHYVTASTKAELMAASERNQLVHGIDDWRDGFYEPMGYHTGGSGTYLHVRVWGTPDKREHIYKYCPEVKMTLYMDAAKYVPGDCGASW